MVAAAPEWAVVVSMGAQSGLLLGGVFRHLNARNETRFALATEEFVTLFLSANWTSRQAERPEATICQWWG